MKSVAGDPHLAASLLDAGGSPEPDDGSKNNWPVGRTPSYVLLEYPHGEDPVVRIYPTALSAARRIQHLDGQEINVHVIYGILLPLTCGPNRMLLLPDGAAVQTMPWVEMFPDGPPGTETLELEQDGFLGGPEYRTPPDLAAEDTSDDNAESDAGDDSWPGG